ncbi:MAG: hypothetical protein V7767_10440 [Leeuwenhoekiella sp.]
MEPAVEYETADSLDSQKMDLVSLRTKLLQESKSSIEFAEDKEDNHFGYTSTDDWDILKEEGDSLTTTTSIPKSRKELGGKRTVVTLFDADKNKGMTVPGSDTLTLKDGQQNLNIYYLQPKLVATNNDTTVYGIGYSIHYIFDKLKKGLDKSDLSNIAASAQLEPEETIATYSLMTYGINTEDGDIMPQQNKSFNVKEYGKLQAEIANLKHVLVDTVNTTSITFTPEKITGLTAKDFE